MLYFYAKSATHQATFIKAKFQSHFWYSLTIINW